jgi:hypothetical protein
LLQSRVTFSVRQTCAGRVKMANFVRHYFVVEYLKLDRRLTNKSHLVQIVEPSVGK